MAINVMVLLALPLAASGAVAAPTFLVDAVVDVAGPATFAGTGRLNATVSGLVVDSEGTRAPNVSLALSFDNATVRIVNAPLALTGGDPEGNPPRAFTWAPPSETQFEETGRGRLVLLEAAGDTTYRVLPLNATDELHADWAGPGSFRLTPRAQWRSGPPERVFTVGRYLDPTGACGSLQPTQETVVNSRGPSYVFLYGGTFHLEMDGYEPQTIRTGQELNSNKSPTDPTGSAGNRWYDRTAIIVEGANVHAAMGAEPGPLGVAVRRATGALYGDLALSDVQGRADVDGRVVEDHHTLLQAIGDFAVDMDYSVAETAPWSFEGQATFVGIDGVAIVGDRAAHLASIAVATAALAGILALVASAFTYAGREALTLVVGRNVAKPLDSPARVELLRHIATSPGMSLGELAAAGGLSKWGARHHLAILKRAALIDELRGGNRAAYVLNSHSHRFELPGPESEGAFSMTEAMAALNHPKRRMILQAVERNGPLSYGGLVQAWQTTGRAPPYPTPADVTYHASKMAEAAVLLRIRRGRQTLWAPNDVLAGAHAHAGAAFARQPTVAAILKALDARPGTTQRELASEVRRSVRRPSETLPGLLVLLEHLGVVEARSGLYFVPAKAAPDRPL